MVAVSRQRFAAGDCRFPLFSLSVVPLAADIRPLAGRSEGPLEDGGAGDTLRSL
jgi:hypothetical protein